MPFTGSHPAAVLPLWGTPLPMSALVAGSMAPDATSYLPGLLFGFPLRSHELAGCLDVNLLIGLVLWAIWHAVLAEPLVAASPAGVRARCAHVPLGIRPRLRRPVDFVLVPAAVVVGAASHVVVDNFTHVWGWAIPHVAVLRSEHLGVPGWTWAQLGLSALGLLVLAFVLHRAWDNAPIAHIPPDRLLLPRSAVAAWCLLGLTGAAGVVRGLQVVAVKDVDVSLLPWHLLTRAIGWAATVGTVLALLWHVGRIMRATQPAREAAPK
jgi:hypothetical protein